MVRNVFALIGILAVILVALVVITHIIELLRDFIERKAHEYDYKHRFDKPPTAKCYCRDCEYWRKEDGKCFKFEGYHTADCWFCWNAEPVSYRESE